MTNDECQGDEMSSDEVSGNHILVGNNGNT